MDCQRFNLRVQLAAGVMLCCSAGCLMSPALRRATDADVAAYHTAGAADSQNPSAPTPAEASHSSTASPSPAELSAAMADVHQLGQSDPAAQQALLDDLRRTDPTLWPQLVHAYRSSLAYRQQSAERVARLTQQNVANSDPNTWNFATPAPTSAAADAVTNTPPQNQFLQSASYPTTATPYPQTAPYAPVYSFQPSPPQSLPAPAEGAILPGSPSADFATNYPNTRLPEVRLAAAEQSVPLDATLPIAPESASAGASPGDWQAQLAAAIRTLESQISASANSSPSAADQAMLRMLYLAAGRRDDALQPLAGVSSAEQEFWSKELAGLAKLFDENDGRNDRERIAEAARQLQQAAAKLAQSAPLAVRNLAFCTEVSSFGVYKPLATQTFKPGQQLLLYAEVENFVSDSTDKGHRTSLSSRYEIVDSRGNRIAGEDFGPTEEHCRNPRRDFFVRYFLKLPQPLAAGGYTLQLTIDDTTASKTARGQIQFDVAE